MTSCQPGGEFSKKFHENVRISEKKKNTFRVRILLKFDGLGLGERRCDYRDGLLFQGPRMGGAGGRVFRTKANGHHLC